MANTSSPEFDHESYRSFAEFWRIELGRILAGERDVALRQRGAASYVKRLINKSTDAPLAQAAFDSALHGAIGRWQPSNTHSLYETFVMLELIAAYQPPSGFTKIVGLMKRNSPLPTIPREEGGYSAGYDLHMKALVTLEYFYPSAQPNWQTDSAFSSYLDVLALQFEYESYCSYAIARLIALKTIDVADGRVRAAIETSMHSIDEILSLLLLRERFASKERELSEIYSQCLMVGPKAVVHFQEVLRGFGVKVEPQSDGVQLEVTFPGRKGAIKLDVSAHFIVEVMALNNQRGLKVAKSLAKKSGVG